MKTRFVKGLAAATILGVAAVPALSTGTAQAQVISKTLDVICVQDDVNRLNGIENFTATASVDITLPDEIYSNTTVEPEVSISVYLPDVVTKTIRNYGYDSMSGLVDVDATVLDPAGEATTLEGDNIVLGKTEVPEWNDPAVDPEGFTINTTGDFGTYDVGEAGTYPIQLEGQIVTVKNVIVTNEYGARRALPEFNCSISEEVGTVDVAELEVIDKKPEEPASNPTSTVTETVKTTVTKSSSPALPKTGS